MERLPPNLEAIADFWDTHSLADYWDQTEPAEFEFAPSACHYYLVTSDNARSPAPKRRAPSSNTSAPSKLNASRR